MFAVSRIIVIVNSSTSHLSWRRLLEPDHREAAILNSSSFARRLRKRTLLTHSPTSFEVLPFWTTYTKLELDEPLVELHVVTAIPQVSFKPEGHRADLILSLAWPNLNQLDPSCVLAQLICSRVHIFATAPIRDQQVGLTQCYGH